METEKRHDIETVNDLIEYLQDSCLLYAPIRVSVAVGSHITTDHVKVKHPDPAVNPLQPWYTIVGEYYDET